MKDRCNARKAATDSTTVASIAATGFGLTAICIADKRGFIPHSDARQRVITTLEFLSNKLSENGTLRSTETLTCRLHRQVLAVTLLDKLERIDAG